MSPWFYGSRTSSWMVDIIYSKFPLTHLRYLNPIATLNISFSLRLSRQMSIFLQSKWSGRKKRRNFWRPLPTYFIHIYIRCLVIFQVSDIYVFPRYMMYLSYELKFILLSPLPCFNRGGKGVCIYVWIITPSNLSRCHFILSWVC